VNIQVKRIYEVPDPEDGRRMLIDRLWPRGLSKANAKVDVWMKEIAPSTKLRQWYQHDPGKWPEFKVRYHAELDAQPDGVNQMISWAATGKMTLLFGSREERLNSARALKEYLESKSRTA
jgi:uncharacterized protein YeaO (DUF488 family)